MEQVSAVLVAFNPSALNEMFAALDLKKVRVAAILMEGAAGNQVIAIGNMRTPILPFNRIGSLLKGNFLWLFGGWPANGIGDFWKMSKFLTDEGVPKDKIVNWHIFPHINREWLGNLKYAETHPIDFFATGISYTEVGLDLNFLANTGGGLNLTCSNQDLRQGYLTARHVFEHQESVKFALIGLAPYSFRYDNRKSFTVCSRNLQYILALNEPPSTEHDKLLLSLIGDQVRNLFSSTTEAQADRNFEQLKTTISRDIPPGMLANWDEELDNLTKKFFPETIEENIAFLEDYIKLCLEHGAKPVAVTFPFAPIIRRHYPKDLLLHFRQTLRQFERIYDFKFIDLFDLPLGYEHFYNMSHRNRAGAKAASELLDIKLHAENVLPSEALTGLTYEQIKQRLTLTSKDEYNALMDRIFAAAIKKIRQKSRIKIGFVTYDASMWCGDDLYQLFARDDRYETTVFLCLRRDQCNEPTVVKDFHHGIDRFRAHGINVVSISEDDMQIPKQDVLIFLTPYLSVLPKAFQLNAVTAETLLTYIPYGFQISANSPTFNEPIIALCWKIFWDTEHAVQIYKKGCLRGMPRGVYSGYPKMDFFLHDEPSMFEWKEAVPNSVKIVYAPHWSINDGVKFATFQWNHKFFYEYAKNHPKTSWVFKPHPNLLFSAVTTGVFPSLEAFEEYLRNWNELPNAKVETGAYYYDIFKSSDGMILDSGSFIAEYQYTHKPMLFLTRDTQQLSQLALDLMQGMYRADGRDLKSIASFVDNVLIKKLDPLVAVRQQMFERHLDYRKANGMSASEFIFKAIDQSLREE